MAVSNVRELHVHQVLDLQRLAGHGAEHLVHLGVGVKVGGRRLLISVRSFEVARAIVKREMECLLLVLEVAGKIVSGLE